MQDSNGRQVWVNIGFFNLLGYMIRVPLAPERFPLA